MNIQGFFDWGKSLFGDSFVTTVQRKVASLFGDTQAAPKTRRGVRRKRHFARLRGRDLLRQAPTLLGHTSEEQETEKEREKEQTEAVVPSFYIEENTKLQQMEFELKRLRDEVANLRRHTAEKEKVQQQEAVHNKFWLMDSPNQTSHDVSERFYPRGRRKDENEKIRESESPSKGGREKGKNKVDLWRKEHPEPSEEEEEQDIQFFVTPLVDSDYDSSFESPEDEEDEDEEEDENGEDEGSDGGESHAEVEKFEKGNGADEVIVDDWGGVAIAHDRTDAVPAEAEDSDSDDEADSSGEEEGDNANVVIIDHTPERFQNEPELEPKPEEAEAKADGHHHVAAEKGSDDSSEDSDDEAESDGEGGEDGEGAGTAVDGGNLPEIRINDSPEEDVENNSTTHTEGRTSNGDADEAYTNHTGEKENGEEEKWGEKTREVDENGDTGRKKKRKLSEVDVALAKRGGSLVPPTIKNKKLRKSRSEGDDDGDDRDDFAGGDDADDEQDSSEDNNDSSVESGERKETVLRERLLSARRKLRKGDWGRTPGLTPVPVPRQARDSVAGILFAGLKKKFQNVQDENSSFREESSFDQSFDFGGSPAPKAT